MPRVRVEGRDLHWEEVGEGPALVCLHSGWGREIMPFDATTERLGDRFRLVFPDRLGYGRSEPIDALPPDFHAREARRLALFLDAIAIERPLLWGHSDGAVIAALFAASHPARPVALVLESIHFFRAKSRDFFARYAMTPDALPAAVLARLEADHGLAGARRVIAMHSKVWLGFHEVGGDFYEGALERIVCPTLLVHGAADPHTPVSEIEEVERRIAGSRLLVVPSGGHSPHSDPPSALETTRLVADFLDPFARI